MLFNSFEFIFIFLPIIFIIYFYLNRKGLIEASKGFLVFSSLFFYSWWNIVYLPIILCSMLFNYLIGDILSRHSNKNRKGLYKRFSKKAILIFGIICNLFLLGYFKYADFFIENMNILFSIDLDALNLLLPLAISFFTFQQIAYLVDSYKEETKEYDFLNYALFVSFFPQLIAGPIVHHKEMMPQFANLRNKVKNYSNILLAIFIFSIGLFKKVVIADTFSIWATAGFDSAVTLNLLEAWATSLSYSLQLYFDFSGYCDMAIGLALLFNIKLPINFNSPYKALNIQDFWRRWHITLSRFLRDYIYIPLGGNKYGHFRTYLNLMTVFLLGGLWHGAGWTFIFWGFLHGLALSIHRAWQFFGFRMWNWLAWFITFNFINITWVFFRAKEWSDAVKVLNGMIGQTGVALPKFLENKLILLDSYEILYGNWLKQINGNYTTVLWIFLGCIIITQLRNSSEYLSMKKVSLFQIIVSALMFVSSLSLMNKVSEFLYFNF